MTKRLRLISVGLGMLTLSCNNPVVDPIVPPPPPPVAMFTLRLREGTVQRISHGEVLALSMQVTREPGFERPISFSATTPSGVEMVFRPSLILTRENTEIRLVVDTTAERTLHRITLRGTDNTGASREVVLELTIDDGG